MMEYDSLFASFFLAYEPEPGEAIVHLENIIHTNINSAEKNSTAVYYLCNAAQKGGLILNELITVKQIIAADSVQYKASFCKVASQDVRAELISHLRDNAESLYQLVEAEIFSEAGIITAERVQDLQTKIEVDNDRNIYAEPSVFAHLVRMVKMPEYAYLKPIVDSAFSGNSCYRLFKDPIKYEGLISEMEGSWYLFVDDDILKRLLENPLARQVVRQFCDNTPWANELKEKVWGMI